MPSIFLLASALFGFYGVATGAIAAHGVDDPIAIARLTTASLYALIHAAILAGWQNPTRMGHVAKTCFTLGTLLFCGALTLRYGFNLPAFGAAAPYGGTLLMVGWLTMAGIATHALITRKTHP